MKYMPLSQSSLANTIILKRLGNALKQKHCQDNTVSTAT